MNYCEAGLTEMDEPPCGKPACIREHGYWLCAVYISLGADPRLIKGCEEEL